MIRDLWLSVTEGDKNYNLVRLDHWPTTTKATEGVWRDYYTGDQLHNYTKPWYTENADNKDGNNSNCIYYHQLSGWDEQECLQSKTGCPCIYETLPILHMRGYCGGANSDLEDSIFTPMHVQDTPINIIIVGSRFGQIKYNTSLQQWILEDKYLDLIAKTDASQLSYALGKHNWTISGDTKKCSKGEPSYKIEMKLTACKMGEFTCDDGQCVAMNQRCNQLPNCRDKSDEIGCKILTLEYGYNQRVPPIGQISLNDGSVTPVPVRISLVLLKVVDIEEEDHSIELQFQITLEWKEIRATYHNLKK